MLTGLYSQLKPRRTHTNKHKHLRRVSTAAYLLSPKFCRSAGFFAPRLKARCQPAEGLEGYWPLQALPEVKVHVVLGLTFSLYIAPTHEALPSASDMKGGYGMGPGSYYSLSNLNLKLKGNRNWKRASSSLLLTSSSLENKLCGFFKPIHFLFCFASRMFLSH